jgi:hypothetical protein
MPKFFVQIFILLFAVPLTANADRDVSFEIDLATRIPALRLVKRGVVLKYSMSDFQASPSAPVSYVGDGTLQFADTETVFPNCIARLIRSASAEDVTATIFDKLEGRKLSTSGIELTFSPDNGDYSRGFKAVKLKFLTEPLILIEVQISGSANSDSVFQRVPLKELCDPVELSLLYERPRH